MDNARGIEIMNEVIRKLSKGKIISFRLNEAFSLAGTGSHTDFSMTDFNELQALRTEYDNQVKNETSTVDINGELNDAYETLFHLSGRLRSLAERIIRSNKDDNDESR